MTNPFPGIDPFVESQKYWDDFHPGFLIYLRDAIIDGLPDHYDVRVEERFTITSFHEEHELRPDLTILRSESEKRGVSSATLGAGAAVLHVTIPLPVLIPEETTERWIEIRRLEDRSVVTVIELLSPTNKRGAGRSRYVEKRQQLVDEPVHLIELDFLLGGKRLPMRGPLPPGDFYALVSRANRRPDSDVYAWSIRSSLPTIPIPLDPPDPDLSLDLASVYATTYERGRYTRVLHRDRPLDLPIATEDQAWMESRTQAFGRE